MITLPRQRRSEDSPVRVQLLCHILLLVLVLASASCSRRYDDYPVYTPFYMKEYPNYGVGRFKTTHLVDQIDEYYRGSHPGPIGVTTFVDVDDLHNSSTFGRVYGEQVMSELAMRGFDVIELRHADALQFLDSTGEFALSRDIALVRRERELGGVVVGTYAVSPVRVYVNARLLDPSTSVVLAAGSVEMSKTKEIARLLRGGAFPASLERIPVQNLGVVNYPFAWWNNPRPSQGFDPTEVSTASPELPKVAAPSLPKQLEKAHKP